MGLKEPARINHFALSRESVTLLIVLKTSSQQHPPSLTRLTGQLRVVIQQQPEDHKFVWGQEMRDCCKCTSISFSDSNSLLLYRPKKLTLKGYKQYWCTFKDTSISCFKSKEESNGTPAHQMNLRGNRANAVLVICILNLLILTFLWPCDKNQIFSYMALLQDDSASITRSLKGRTSFTLNSGGFQNP